MLNQKMQEYTQALYDRCKDPITGNIVDPITQEIIDEKDLWILSHNEESISYTSIQTLYKSLVLDNKTVCPFDRTPIDELDIDMIEEYGRKRKIRVRFFDAGRRYDSPHRDTMYIFDWFLTLEKMLIRVFKATNNMQRHKSLLFELNGKDITDYDLKAEIESISENGEIILSAVDNPEYHQEENTRESNTLREAVTNMRGESFMVGIRNGENIIGRIVGRDDSGNIIPGHAIGYVAASGNRSEAVGYHGGSRPNDNSIQTGNSNFVHDPSLIQTGLQLGDNAPSQEPEVEEPETVEMVVPSFLSSVFRNFIQSQHQTQPQPQEPAPSEAQQNFISTIFDRVAQNARSPATAEVMRNPNAGMMDLFNTLMTPNVTQDIPFPDEDVEDLDLD